MTTSSKRFVGLLIMLMFVLGVSTTVSALEGEPATPTPTFTVTTSPTPTFTPTSTPTLTSTPTSTPIPTETMIPTPAREGLPPYNDWAQEDPEYRVPWTVKCDDDEPLNGYRLGEWARGFCVPGMITKESQFFRSPTVHYGLMSSYSDGIMEAQVRHRGYDPNEVEGVALMSCDHHGETVYLQTPDGTWYGPFIVVDCSGRNHMYYHMIGLGLVVEVSNKQAKKMGGLVLQEVKVSLGGKSSSRGEYLAYFWVDNILEWEGW